MKNVKIVHKQFFRKKPENEIERFTPDLNSSSSSLNASQWATVVERTTPLENGRWFPDVHMETNKPIEMKKPETEETPKLTARPVLNNARLISAEEVLAAEGPDDWSRLTEFMKTRTVSRPERSRSEPMKTISLGSLNISKKRKRPPTPE